MIWIGYLQWITANGFPRAALDDAVWAAYSWDDPDSTVGEEETFLRRLLASNLERANEKVESETT